MLNILLHGFKVELQYDNEGRGGGGRAAGEGRGEEKEGKEEKRLILISKCFDIFAISSHLIYRLAN